MCNISEFVLRNKVNKTPIATLFNMQLQMVVLVGRANMDYLNCNMLIHCSIYAHTLFATREKLVSI